MEKISLLLVINFITSKTKQMRTKQKESDFSIGKLYVAQKIRLSWADFLPTSKNES